MATKKSTPKQPSRQAAAAVAALMAQASDAPAVDPSEVEFAAQEAAASDAGPDENTGEVEHVETTKPKAGSWMRAQTPPVTKGPSYRLVSLAKPRRVLHDAVPESVVKFVHNDEGRKELVFDGIRCPRGVVTYHGHKAYLDGGPAQSPHASEIASIRARLAELEQRPVGDFYQEAAS